MSDTPLPLPAGLRWIKLVCRLGRLAHDGADADDKPDLLPTAGKVRLASSPARLRVQESDGRWRSVSLDEREYTIRADGELVDTEGRVGVWIPDPASELLDPRPYTLVATVTPTVGERWAAKITGETLPDVVDLVAHSETVAIPASAVPGLSSRIASVEGILADGGTGSTTRGLIVTAVDVPTIPAGDTTDNLAAYYNSAAEPITVAGVELAAGSHAVWAWVSGAWTLLAAGAGSPADTTAPVWPSGAYAAVSNPTDTTATVALSALPVDDTAVAKYQVRVYVAENSGTASWEDATLTGTTISLVGLTPSTVYQPVEVRALDAAGNASAVLYTNTGLTTTAPPALTFSKVYFSDSFNRPDGQAGTLDNAYGGTASPVPTWGTATEFTVASNQLSITAMNRQRDIPFGENAPEAALRFKRTSTHFNVGLRAWRGRMSTGGEPVPVLDQVMIARDTSGAHLIYPDPDGLTTGSNNLTVALNGGSELGVWSLKVDPDGTCTAISPSGLTTTATWWSAGDTAESGRYVSAARISSYGFNSATTLDDLVVGVKA